MEKKASAEKAVREIQRKVLNICSPRKQAGNHYGILPKEKSFEDPQ